jgi:small subunit ribosomal protein S8
MPITDLIADALTMIRNASALGKPTVNIPASNVLEKIMEILKKESYIDNYKRIADNKQGTLRVYLKFGPDQDPAISGLKRISKPGLRVYSKKDKIPLVLRGMGVAVISTSKGIVTDKEARQLGLGGEVLCYVW